MELKQSRINGNFRLVAITLMFLMVFGGLPLLLPATHVSAAQPVQQFVDTKSSASYSSQNELLMYATLSPLPEQYIFFSSSETSLSYTASSDGVNWDYYSALFSSATADFSVSSVVWSQSNQELFVVAPDTSNTTVNIYSAHFSAQEILLNASHIISLAQPSYNVESVMGHDGMVYSLVAFKAFPYYKLNLLVFNPLTSAVLNCGTVGTSDIQLIAGSISVGYHGLMFTEGRVEGGKIASMYYSYQAGCPSLLNTGTSGFTVANAKNIGASFTGYVGGVDTFVVAGWSSTILTHPLVAQQYTQLGMGNEITYAVLTVDYAESQVSIGNTLDNHQMYIAFTNGTSGASTDWKLQYMLYNNEVGAIASEPAPQVLPVATGQHLLTDLVMSSWSTGSEVTAVVGNVQIAGEVWSTTDEIPNSPIQTLTSTNTITSTNTHTSLVTNVSTISNQPYSTQTRCNYQDFNPNMAPTPTNPLNGIYVVPVDDQVVYVYQNNSPFPITVNEFDLPVYFTGNISSNFVAGIYQSQSTQDLFQLTWNTYVAVPIDTYNQNFSFTPNVLVPAGTFYSVAFADENTTDGFYTLFQNVTYATTGMQMYAGQVNSRYNCGYYAGAFFNSAVGTGAVQPQGNALPQFYSYFNLYPQELLNASSLTHTFSATTITNGSTYTIVGSPTRTYQPPFVQGGQIDNITYTSLGTTSTFLTTLYGTTTGGTVTSTVTTTKSVVTASTYLAVQFGGTQIGRYNGLIRYYPIIEITQTDLFQHVDYTTTTITSTVNTNLDAAINEVMNSNFLISMFLTFLPTFIIAVFFGSRSKLIVIMWLGVSLIIEQFGLLSGGNPITSPAEIVLVVLFIVAYFLR